MEGAKHIKAGREERARYGPRTRGGARSEASGWTERLCKGHEGHLDLTCRQVEKPLKVLSYTCGHLLSIFGKLTLGGTVSGGRKER